MTVHVTFTYPQTLIIAIPHLTNCGFVEIIWRFNFVTYPALDPLNVVVPLCD